MRPARQKQIIALHLEGLANVNKKLETLQESVTDAIKKGEKWLEEKDDEGETFLEMNQFLAKESCRCLEMCFNIANENEEMNISDEASKCFSESEARHSLSTRVKDDTNECELSSMQFNESNQRYSQGTEERISELSKKYENLTTLMETFLQKIESLEKDCMGKQQIEELARRQLNIDTKMNSRLSDVINEINAFKEYTKLDTESLSQRIKTCEKHFENAAVLKIEDESASNLLDLDSSRTTLDWFELDLNEIASHCEKRSTAVLRRQEQYEQSISSKVDEISKQLNTLKHFVENYPEQMSYFLPDQRSRENIRKILDISDRMLERADQMKMIIEKQKELQVKFDKFSEVVKSDQLKTNLSLATLISDHQTASSKIYQIEICISDLLQLKKMIVSNWNLNKETTLTLQSNMEALDSNSKHLAKNIKENKTFLMDISLEIQDLKKYTETLSTALTQTRTSYDEVMMTLQKKFTRVDVKISEFVNDIETMSKEIYQLRFYNVTEAFCTQVGPYKQTDIIKDEVIKLFSNPVNIHSTLPINYNAETGKYTAPCDGLYLVSLVAENVNGLKVHFGVTKVSGYGSQGGHTMVHTYHNEVTSCFVVPLILRKDDQLFIKSLHDYSSLKLAVHSFFSCILLRKFVNSN
ncbi:coiled-coil domain-containing protein 186 [Biomphalaria pfeifferi]|uniref:Coiled-coil domain-containing protein 186 n=1 Tax=Biomphalaria pfeifferi TaxID=112525 RepID=A0AAD8FD62_BIOPF|nr:coiled-coil domain-containing protein 186 [Biomphalaria pfeifferi]